ncbi:MAG: phosphotransferase [Acidobacteria bacterium]|nr:phosphotransferase [Acidobacteriota bacterium]
MARPDIPANGKAITADWMRLALRAGGASDVPAIQEVAVEDIGSDMGLMAEIVRCRLVWSEPTDAVPASVVVKLPSPAERSRRLSRLQALYKREYAYYRHVAPQGAMRSPRLLYGDYEEKSDRFVLVLEDLGGMHTGDQLAGATAEEARSAVRAVARLHGRNWNAVGRPPLSGFHDVGSPKNRTVVQIIFLAYLVPTLEHFGSFFSDEMRALVEAYGPRAADHLADLRATPQTFVHGDYRLDNMFFGAGNGSDAAVVDWQVSGLGNGLYDVAYFMGGSVPTEVRREIERDLLAEYAEIVGGMGARDFTFDDCWRLYRQNMLACFLIMIIVCGGLDLDDARMRRLVETGMRRTLAAMEDLDAAEFLPAPRPVLSPSNLFSSLSRLAYRGYRALR